MTPADREVNPILSNTLYLTVLKSSYFEWKSDHTLAPTELRTLKVTSLGPQRGGKTRSPHSLGRGRPLPF